MSKRNVSPAASGAAEVRPQKPTKRRSRARRDVAPENAPPAPTPSAASAAPAPAPSVDSVVTPPFFYERAFKRLKTDVQFSDLDLREEEVFKRIEDCKGYDYLAGEFVANAVKGEEMDAWDFVDLMTKLIEGVVEDHQDDAEREKAVLLLSAATMARTRIILERTRSEEACLNALDALVETVDKAEDWQGSPIVALALDVIWAIQFAATGWKTKRATRPVFNLAKQLDCTTRDLLRSVRAYGGHSLMLKVFERLKAELGLRRGPTAVEVAEDMLRYAHEVDARKHEWPSPG